MKKSTLLNEDEVDSKRAMSALMLSSETDAFPTRSSSSVKRSTSTRTYQPAPFTWLNSRRSSAKSKTPNGSNGDFQQEEKESALEIALPRRSRVISSDFSASCDLLVLGTEAKGIALIDVRNGSSSRCSSFQATSAE